MISNVSFSGRLLQDNVAYLRTGNFTNQDSDSEIILNQNDVVNLTNKLHNEFHHFDRFTYIDSKKMNKYIKELNKLMPKYVKLNPTIDRKNRYSVYKNTIGDCLQLRDETNGTHILSITPDSIHEEPSEEPTECSGPTCQPELPPGEEPDIPPADQIIL